MDSSKLQAIKDQLKFYTTNYATPGAVSPNVLQPQLVLDLIDEIERLSVVRPDMHSVQRQQQNVALAFAEHNDLLEEIRDQKVEVDKLYAEVRQLKADLAAARKGTAKKRTP